MSDISVWIERLLDRSYEFDADRRASLAAAIQTAVADADQDGYYRGFDSGRDSAQS